MYSTTAALKDTSWWAILSPRMVKIHVLSKRICKVMSGEYLRLLLGEKWLQQRLTEIFQLYIALCPSVLKEVALPESRPEHWKLKDAPKRRIEREWQGSVEPAWMVGKDKLTAYKAFTKPFTEASWESHHTLHHASWWILQGSSWQPEEKQWVPDMVLLLLDYLPATAIPARGLRSGVRSIMIGDFQETAYERHRMSIVLVM